MSKRRSAKPDVKLLGHEVRVAASPDKAILERVPNPHPDTTCVARFGCRRVTSLCPLRASRILPIWSSTMFPVPGCWKGKSLKLYLESFRNHGGFHEDCTVSIGRRIAELIKPRYIRIGDYWYPRGSIPSGGSCNPGSMMFFCIPM
jgi:7-cyano-7-deazaguanine reductase